MLPCFRLSGVVRLTAWCYSSQMKPFVIKWAHSERESFKHLRYSRVSG